MREPFLYYLWEHRLLTPPLCTADGETVEIVHPGYRNLDSGPDFLEARIRIGGQLWAGQVEIHVRTSDWKRHGHQSDKAYRNVILHVVYDHDAQVNTIPVLPLRGRFNERLYDDYQHFVNARSWIPCDRQIGSVSTFTLTSWLDRMAIERLQYKSDTVGRMLAANRYDWEDTLYRLLLRYFGMKVNNEAFEYLAGILPFKSLLKHADRLEQVEAMLLGCAGFLGHDFEEDYPRLLRREFQVMQAKFDLLTMPEERWKFMRMRPGNFPTVRMAQLAQMIHRHGCLFSKMREAAAVTEVRALFDVCASAYWDTHFRFAAEGPFRPKHLGLGTANVLIINAVVPMLFCYGKFHKDASYCDKAMRFLEEIPTEDNYVTRQFAISGIHADNAMQSQGLLQMYFLYCQRKRCLECSIGNVLIQ